MKKYKICVYAICKNEEKFVDRWMDSVSEADKVIVLDTGSTDSTVDKLIARGAKVTVEEIKPWRFDIARNKSLDLVPKDADICVCIDIDEVLNKGWRKKLEELWEPDLNQLLYIYNWSFDQYGKPAVSFYYEKIHDRHNYVWHHPVHEVLKYIGKETEKKKTTDDIILSHYPDSSKSRSQYLSLLELSVKEDSEDDRNTHYLGREYMYNSRWQEAIDTLHKHLNLKRATWKAERAASMRYMGRCYKALGYLEEARLWFGKAITECPEVREGLVELGTFEYEQGNYGSAVYLLKNALTIKEKSKSYINESFCWDSTIYDILSVCCYNLELYEESYGYVCKALKMNPKDQRIKNNKKMISEKANLK